MASRQSSTTSEISTASCQTEPGAHVGNEAFVALYDSGPAHALIAKHEALAYPYRCMFGGAQFEIDRGVFCPVLTNASPLLLESIDFRAGDRVLDVFAGSGAFGILAAVHGADAVTVDIAALAVACTLKNAALNCVESRVDARLGTMVECLAPNEVFDLIIANPPLLPGEPGDVLAAAIFDPQLHATYEFIDELPHHLAPFGRCYLLASDVVERYGHDIDRLCRQRGLESSVVAKADFGYETYRVHRIVREKRPLRRGMTPFNLTT